MFLKIYILMVLLVNGECAYQNGRFKNGYRQNSAASNAGLRPRARNCSPPRLVNGIVTPLFKGKLMRFDCVKGYSRLGERYAECLSGRWSIYTFPVCIKAGCLTITTPDNGKITYLNAKASAMLFCEPNYETVGSSYAHCNGTHWDRGIGTCRETDNAPATSCDFESESICGWTHDTDHDFDFERRSGYNNKTISMVTGPHADHTTGIPFQGHYMVINTNSEVFTKRARLISPLFLISAQTLCFKFYYHMYGVSIGTLRVYMKPESAEMQEVILEDTESEARNDFVVFEIKGSQGNYWNEGGGFMKPVNESFQIIIEAVSGQTRLSDIAFDDVSILSDGECSDDEDDTKSQSQKVEDDDGAFSVDSCVNRCFEEKNLSLQLNANHTLSCSCSRDCEFKVSCCPDFIDICLNEASSANETTSTLQPTTVVERTTTTMLTTKSSSPTRTTRITTTTSTSTVRTTKLSPVTSRVTNSSPATNTTTRVALKLPRTLPIFNQTEASVVKSTEEDDDGGEFLESDVKGEDEHDVELDEISPATTAYESDNIMNERFMMKTKSDSLDVSLIIKVAVIVITTVFLSFIAFFVVYKQYKKSTNPLNYKEKQENGSKKANEEFSEIRFLTSDETLDFNLASHENSTDL